jgi:hypothetical protein
MSSSGLASPRSTLSGPTHAHAAAAGPEAGSRSWWNSLTREEVSLLLSAYAVLFSRYLVSQQLAGFFTSVADNAGISSSWVGLIFMVRGWGEGTQACLGETRISSASACACSPLGAFSEFPRVRRSLRPILWACPSLQSSLPE